MSVVDWVQKGFYVSGDECGCLYIRLCYKGLRHLTVMPPYHKLPSVVIHGADWKLKRQ